MIFYFITSLIKFFIFEMEEQVVFYKVWIEPTNIISVSLEHPKIHVTLWN